MLYDIVKKEDIAEILKDINFSLFKDYEINSKFVWIGFGGYKHIKIDWYSFDVTGSLDEFKISKEQHNEICKIIKTLKNSWYYERIPDEYK